MKRQSGLTLLLLLFAFDTTSTQEGSGDPVANADCTDAGYPTVDNAAAFTGDMKHDSLIDVVCNNGYYNTGSEQYICNDGAWEPAGNGAEPYCARQCGVPEIANGEVALKSNSCTYEDCMAQFTCDSGYTLSGQETLTCQNTGSYGILPECEIVDCNDPSIPNGQYSGNTTYQSEVTFTCNDDYGIVGSDTAKCGPDGDWSELPTCTYTCDTHQLVANSEQTESCSGDQFAGCTVTVTCISGFTLEGNATVECVEGHGWVYDPHCKTLAESSTSASYTLATPVPLNMDPGDFSGHIQPSLISYFRQKMGPTFKNLVVHSVKYRKKQGLGTNTEDIEDDLEAVIDYTVVTEDSDIARGQFSEAQAELVATETITINGTTVEPTELHVYNNTYYRDGSSAKSVSCEIFFNEYGPCPKDSVCDITQIEGDSLAMCIAAEKEDDLSLELGLGLGIPLFLLACGLGICCCCCCYYFCGGRRKKRKYEESDTATVYGVAPLYLPLRFNNVGRMGPVYGSEFPERWSDSGSIDDDTRSEASFNPYVVSIGRAGPKPETSNFSWDFMYPNLDTDFQLPRPRV